MMKVLAAIMLSLPQPATHNQFVPELIEAPAVALPAPAPVDLSMFTPYNVVHFVWELHGVTDLATHIKMDCVINYESRWDQYARSRTGDSGYFQINDIHKWRWAWEDGYLDIKDPWLNAEIAYQLWAERGGNFAAWSPPARWC